MKIMLRDFNAKVGREDIFKPTVGNENLHEIGNDNGVRVACHIQKFIVKSTTFLHRNIHTFNWASPDGKTHN
jgi:hypothetical protein